MVPVFAGESPAEGWVFESVEPGPCDNGQLYDVYHMTYLTDFF